MANNRLTWNNVAAPNFSGVADNYRAFSQLLGNAMQSGEGMLNVFRDARQNAADNAIMQRMLSAEQYNPAAILGSDGSAASKEILGLVNNQADTLLKRQVVRDTHGQNQRDWDFLNSGRQQLIDNSGALNAAQLAAAATGDVSGYNGINVRADILNDYLTRGSNLATQALSRDSTRQNIEQSDYTHRRQIRADQLTDQTQRIYADLRNNGFDLDTWDAYLASRPDLPPEVANAAYAEISRLAGAGAGAGAPTTGGGGGNVSALSIMTGGAQLPSSIQTIGQFVDNKSSLLRTNPQGTATGLYQITSDTWADFAPKALGRNWRNANIRDPEVQDAVAKEIWDASNGSASSIRNRWISLSPAQAQSFVGRPWEEVRDVISQGESSTTASSILGGMRRPASAGTRFSEQLDTLTQQAADSATGITGKYVRALSNDNSVAAATKAVMDAGTLGEGVTYDQIFRNIERVMDTARRAGNRNVTPAIAAEIVERNIRSTGLLDMAVDIVNPLRWFGRNGSLGTNLRLDTDRTEADINDVGAGTVQARLRQMFDREQDQAELTAADEAADAAAERLRVAVLQSQRRPGISQHIPRLQEEYQRALDHATRLRGGNPDGDTGLLDFITRMENNTSPVDQDIFGNRAARALQDAAGSPAGTGLAPLPEGQLQQLTLGELPANTPAVVPADRIEEVIPNPVPGGMVERLIAEGKPVRKETLEYHNAIDNSWVVESLKTGVGRVLRGSVAPVRGFYAGANDFWDNLPANRNYMPRRPERQ